MNDRPLVVLTVGTDVHPFDRAVLWVDAWAAANPDVEVVCQYGTSRTPANATGGPLLPRPELDALLHRAAAVVSHGGPATLAQVRAAGTRPLCIPRDPTRGEHVDDHQQRFARHQAGRDRLTLVEDEATLHALLDHVTTDAGHFDIDPTRDAADAAVAVRRFGAFVDALVDRDDGRVGALHAEAVEATGRTP